MNQDKYINSRTYQLQCAGYCKKHTGQRVNSFYQRYKILEILKQVIVGEGQTGNSFYQRYK